MRVELTSAQVELLQAILHKERMHQAARTSYPRGGNVVRSIDAILKRLKRGQ